MGHLWIKTSLFTCHNWLWTGYLVADYRFWFLRSLNYARSKINWYNVHNYQNKFYYSCNMYLFTFLFDCLLFYIILLQTLMESCWAHLAHHRSHVHDILKELQKKDVCILYHHITTCTAHISSLEIVGCMLSYLLLLVRKTTLNQIYVVQSMSHWSSSSSVFHKHCFE